MEITLKYIADEVIKNSGFNIRMQKREAHLILLRQVYYKLARKHTLETFTNIGKEVKVHYSSVMYGFNKADRDLKRVPLYKTLYNSIESKITGLKEDLEDNKNIVVNFKTDELRQLNKLSYTDILDFNETRLKPYLKMLESRRVHNIKEVKGAMLREKV